MCFKVVLLQHAPGEVAGRDNSSGRAQIHADGDGVGSSKRQQDRRTAAGGFTADFLDEAFDSELFDTQRHSPALQRGFAGDLRARDGSTFANIVEDDLSIDIADRIRTSHVSFLWVRVS